MATKKREFNFGIKKPDVQSSAQMPKKTQIQISDRIGAPATERPRAPQSSQIAKPVDIAVEEEGEFNLDILKTDKKDEVNKITGAMLNRVIDAFDRIPRDTPENESKVIINQAIRDQMNIYVSEHSIHLSANDKKAVSVQIINEIFGFGPLTPLLNDDSITEVMVNSKSDIYVERFGKVQRVDLEFRDDNHVNHIIDKIITPLGRRIDESSPMVDARLPDGSRVNIIIPPLAISGPTITIRKFETEPFTPYDLIASGSLNRDMMLFLKSCIEGKINIIISGGTGSGKTTLLNVLSSYIGNTERIVTIEDAAELQLQQPHVVSLESRPANIAGKGAISIKDLVSNALRMNPSRIVVGEVRGEETLDMLQSMNTGHDGSMTTAHANTPRDLISRLEVMILMGGIDIPSRAIRQQISSAINLVVQVNKLPDGSRKIDKITEITGMEGESVSMQDIFKFERDGYSDKGIIRGRHVATGLVPTFLDKIKNNMAHVPADIFRSNLNVRG